MFTILFASFTACNEKIPQILRQRLPDTAILECTTLEEAFLLCRHREIHCVLLLPDEEFIQSQRLLKHLRSKEAYHFTPVLFLSSRLEHLFWAFWKWNCCECCVIPLTRERQEELVRLLQHYHEIYCRTRLLRESCFRIDTPKGIFSVPYDDILYIEIVLKKTIIHTKTAEYAFPLPLYKVKEDLNCPFIVQTHRSFLVNLHNISQIDKSKSPWEISFFQSGKHAYISRHFKKSFLENILSSIGS
ncbi:LytTR family transcriptional regulator DNA-binding domain-containing protein [Anaerotignum lactatifermentans]|uniref:LytTR family transcriptional regulator DNA-binding domain-containing protein n=1 Tax=Anaerotignum lactatifermentans TaxID=160404 RepID=A0ABS2G7W3_9FIRM|nr:LytTR family DNA-binding domain-containing protein [Anaerotignum lactatifermentans]MBM6828089.1 LytTR family transcriptional regulator DNA-binding domain-containing protein [Anaerotignum lactatifermentans]MBM6876748.1 LytTR family transcriptional regulator DNA-binding domain-containing protein [Anaerotignum lactatifermentans]MBM6949672.1 LytTR family transcriptional regulator DNA-binding domain-containing protein [Anaerotignum lactatifermentans]